MSIKTPPPKYDTAHVTLSDEKVFDEYQKFVLLQKPKSTMPNQPVVPSPPPPKVQHGKKSVASNQNFELEKKKIQRQFITSLQDLDKKLSSYSQKNSTAYKQGKKLYKTLFEAQEKLFNQITAKSKAVQVNKSIMDFRAVCENNINTANAVMGHGWLYRIAEVLIKAVGGLLAGVGMILGVPFGQGLVKEAHRKAYKDTFFTASQTESNEAINRFSQKVLGENTEDKQGLLDPEKLTPKNN